MAEIVPNTRNLPALTRGRYENIFNVCKVVKDKNNSYYFYNILNKVSIPTTLDEGFLGSINITRNQPWTTVSNDLYGTIDLWWLLNLINKPTNIFIAEAGTTLQYILPEYIELVISSIEKQIGV